MGVVGAGTAGATGGSEPSAMAAHDDSEMSVTWVDVEDGDEVSGIVADVEDGNLLVFPEGEFRWTESVGVTADNWGLLGQPHDGTVFIVPSVASPYRTHCPSRLRIGPCRAGPSAECSRHT